MAKSVRGEVWDARKFGKVVDDGAHLTLVDAIAAGAHKQRGRCGIEVDATAREPGIESPHCGLSAWDDPFLVSLAEHAHGAFSEVDVVDIDAGELADTYSGCVQQFCDRPVPDVEWLSAVCTHHR